MDQIVLPTNIIRKVNKLSRELEVVKKEIKKAVKISKDQAWFWSKNWQAKEKVADKAIKEGKTKTFSSMERLVNDLHQ